MYTRNSNRITGSTTKPKFVAYGQFVFVVYNEGNYGDKHFFKGMKKPTSKDKDKTQRTSDIYSINITNCIILYYIMFTICLIFL